MKRANSTEYNGVSPDIANNEGHRIPLFTIKKKRALLIAITVFVLEVPVGVMLPLFLGAFAAYIADDRNRGPSVAGIYTIYATFVVTNLGMFGWMLYGIMYDEIHRYGHVGIRVLRCIVLLAAAFVLYVYILGMAVNHFYTFMSWN